jgi:hypothetical protein
VAYIQIQNQQESALCTATIICLGITTTIMLTAAPEVLFGLPGLHLKMDSDAQAGIYRLSCNQEWKLKSIW